MKQLVYVCLFALGAFTVSANTLYFQGYETDASGWNDGSGNPGGVSRVLSGTGGITASSGGYYGLVTNINDASGYPGFGDGGFTRMYRTAGNRTSYPGGPFSQSIDIYVNTSLTEPSPGSPALWVDMYPSTQTTDDNAGCGVVACADEHNFRLTYTGSAVDVSVDGTTAPMAVIGTSGWYTFQTTYAQGPTPTSLVQNTLNVYNHSGTLVGTQAAQGDSDGGTLMSNNLGGAGTIWLPYWENNFSSNQLATDNVRVDAANAIPEPATLALIGAGLIGLAAIRRRRA